MPEQPHFTADSLIEVFGDQAYHKGVRMVLECLRVGDDPESCRELSQANIELMKRGYHKKPLCQWCAEGNPRVRSSVNPDAEIYVHTDTPLGRVVCGGGK